MQDGDIEHAAHQVTQNDWNNGDQPSRFAASSSEASRGKKEILALSVGRRITLSDCTDYKTTVTRSVQHVYREVSAATETWTY